MVNRIRENPLFWIEASFTPWLIGDFCDILGLILARFTGKPSPEGLVEKAWGSDFRCAPSVDFFNNPGSAR